MLLIVFDGGAAEHGCSIWIYISGGHLLRSRNMTCIDSVMVCLWNPLWEPETCSNEKTLPEKGQSQQYNATCTPQLTLKEKQVIFILE